MSSSYFGGSSIMAGCLVEVIEESLRELSASQIPCSGIRSTGICQGLKMATGSDCQAGAQVFKGWPAPNFILRPVQEGHGRALK